MFAHLHVYSNYSFLEGLSSPVELAQAAKKIGYPAIALTDHWGFTGAVEFYDACLDNGIQPILGLDLDLSLPSNLPSLPNNASSGSLVLLAEDLTGWSNLCQLSSCAFDDQGLSSPMPVSLEFLAKHSRGLICLTGGLRGLVTRLVQNQDMETALTLSDRLRDIFPQNLFIELQQHHPSDRRTCEVLIQLARKLGLPYTATHFVHYISKDQTHLQNLVAAIRLNRSMANLPEGTTAPPGAYLTTPEEMSKRFNHFPRALETTSEIVERCKLTLPLGKPRYPHIDLEGNEQPVLVLRRKAEAGAVQQYGNITSAIQTRIDHELSIISELGYAPLFLIMEEVIAFTRQQGIPVSSRGSAASSLVAHCLGITDPDPLRLDLYFERFLNPARKSPPDIDTDLCSRRRDEVIQFVYERFGQERVAMVSTINRFRPRSALREAAKAHGLRPDEIQRLAKLLPNRWYGSPSINHEQISPYAEITREYTSQIHQAVIHDAQALLGLPHHLSIHPGGVVIAPDKLTDISPTQMASKGVRITQFDLESIERLGLVKIDLLGIRGLTVLGDVAGALQRRNSTEITLNKPSSLLNRVPLDDPATAELVKHGNTIGCFQIESPGMRATLKEIGARSMDDVMVALALYRPGPLSGGLKDAFVRRHRGLEDANYLHPALEPLLRDTYGVILYQEQVLRIAHELAGLSLSDADLLRRAMSHFDPGKQMDTLRLKFIAGAYRLNNVSQEHAEIIWELMAAFAGYGFPKAHAASYAQIAWQAAWCKSHYPALFMAAVLANWGGYYSQQIYLNECRRMKLGLHPPLVNHAMPEFSVGYINKKPELVMGLNQVRELTRKTRDRIINGRPFSSIADFLMKVDPRPVEAENLVRCGALEELGAIPGLLAELQSGGWQRGQLQLFSIESEGENDWSPSQKISAQEAILGASIASHPLQLFESQITDAGAVTTIEAAARIDQRVRVAGMRQVWRRARTNQDEYIYFLSLEDLEGMINVIIPTPVYQHARRELSGKGPFIIEGMVELDRSQGEVIIRAEHIWKINQV